MDQVEMPTDARAACADYLRYIRDGEQICEEANRRVTEWRYATHRMYSPEPFFDTHDVSGHNGWKRIQRKWVDDPAKAGFFGPHGYDAAEKLVCVSDRLFYFFTDSGVDVVDYLSPTKVQYLERFVLDSAGSVRVKINASEGGVSRQEFVKADGRYASSTERRWLLNDDGTVKEGYGGQYHYEYDDAGELRRAWSKFHVPPHRPRRTLLFDTSPLAEFDDALVALEKMLVEMIPAAVRDRGPMPSPLYAVMINYCGEDLIPTLPPELVLGFSSLRDEIVAKHGEGVTYYAWAPDEIKNLSTEVRLDWGQERESALQDLCFRIKRLEDATEDAVDELSGLKRFLAMTWRVSLALTGNSQFQKVRTMLCKVARELNDYPWDTITPVTDDFVVFAVDGSQELDVLSDFRKSIPADKRTLLKSRRLIR
ncbi:MAG: hypothetical protein K8T91_06110 [Planctomycetes bacterium]|nr:hypothetical protein [Planctomycetota bacterium]